MHAVIATVIALIELSIFGAKLRDPDFCIDVTYVIETMRQNSEQELNSVGLEG